MPKPSEIFDTPEATGFSRVGGNDEVVEKLQIFKFNREKENGYRMTHDDYIEFFLTILTTKDQEKEEAIRAEREKIVEIIKDELRNAPLEVQMTKGIIFANVVYRIGALPTEDNK